MRWRAGLEISLGSIKGESDAATMMHPMPEVTVVCIDASGKKDIVTDTQAIPQVVSHGLAYLALMISIGSCLSQVPAAARA